MLNSPVKVPVVYTVAGDTIDFPSYTFYDGNNIPVDISSWTFVATWRANNVTIYSIPLDVDDSEAVDGILKISVESEVSVNIKTPGIWVLVATHNTSGDIKTVLVGKTQMFYDG
ncbi:MAG: hypothetical protein ACRC5T_03565 [Cetobacterium sp.]